ncbi:TKL/LISK/LISK-DD1 protein kinase [Kwoniella heveanensis BCC8398]|uniref:TKL/LISK/LISK-DD1 protein kinase n=1 Tax=Kwoniella heveanensis BCC8398 TaxID=1296120 RepID=A0A1B9GPU9_9TREE|nr:TKL/LISK/LISK-DD1 protein kinase [Kwoniella heveanensis BCC8398]
MDFDIIPFEDIQWGHRLGAGSFGSVYKGSYLGIDIAIKEVLPSTEYDVHKYFEREWRIMRECRHPNIVLFLGLSKAPDDDGRVFIISEFVPRGNLRQYILSPHPFPWRLRLSFATDVARAVAYLHARQCIHRDLKGENLLITSNERVKVTDFGFARIASRNAEEMRRMTYCGTDGYMSPEIINGLEFDLPTDVFSLGIIFIEIMSRRLVDSKTYTRQAPHFVLDPREIQRRASHGCPPALIALALHCTLEDPAARPRMPEVLSRLREIELEVLSRLDDPASEHVGSIRLVHREGKRAMPIFDGGGAPPVPEARAEEEDRRAEEEALRKLATMELDVGGDGASSLSSSTERSSGDGEDKWRTARWDEIDSLKSYVTASSEMKGHERLLPSSDTTSSFGSAGTRGDGGGQSWSSYFHTLGSPDQPLVQTASVLRSAVPGVPHSQDPPGSDADEMGSTMTIRGGPASPPVPSYSTNHVGEAQGGVDTQKGIREDPMSTTVTGTGQTDQTEAPARPEAVARPVSAIRLTPAQTTLDPRSTTPTPVPIPRKDQAGVSVSQVQNDHIAKDLRSAIEGSTVELSNAKTGQTATQRRASGNGLGTHRFTLVDQASAPLINGKKLSSNFTSTFAFAFFPRALSTAVGASSSPSGNTNAGSSSTGSPSKNGDSTSGGGGIGVTQGQGQAQGRCTVCSKKVGIRPGLQCDDCHGE